MRIVRLGLLVILLALITAAQLPDRVPAEVIVGRSADLFLVDDTLIAARHGVHLVHAPVVKYARNPVLVADRPWEKGLLNYACVLHDTEQNLYKLWYEIRDDRDYGRLAYAQSRDGLTWEKPVLNLVEWEGSKANNLVWVPQPGRKTKVYWVMKDYADPDPAKRYKMMYHKFDFRGRGVAVAESPDGLRWTGRDYSSLVGEFDTQNVMFWDDRVGACVAYLRFRISARLHIARATSPNCYHWSDPVPVHGPDFDDPPGRDLYTPGVFKYGKGRNVYVMYPAVLDSSDNKVKSQLGVSRDGIRWYRFRDLFLPLAADGEWDSGVTYPVAAEASVGGKAAVYYTGNSKGHGVIAGRPGVGVAFLQEGAFAGWRADTTGVVTTQPLRVRYVQDWLYVNAQSAHGGALDAELLDVEGNVVPGFSRRDFQTVRADGPMLLLRWTNMAALESVLAKPFRLRFHLDRAAVYGIQCKLRPRAANPQ